MGKYSSKIVNFLYKNAPMINLIDNNSYHNPKIQDYDVLEKISKIIQNENARKKNEITQITTTSIPSIHTDKQPPLMYLFYQSLYNSDIINVFYKDVPNLNDFDTFIKWYRSVDHDIFHNKRESYFSSNIDKLKDSNIIEKYKLLYETEGIRELLHSHIYGNSFISLDIQHSVESTDLSYLELEYDSIGKKTKIHLFFPENLKPRNIDSNSNSNSESNSNSDSIDMDIIFHILYTMDELYLQNNRDNDMYTPNPDLDLTLILTNQKKILDAGIFLKSADRYISYENINSGSTYPRHSVVIWRREEIYKVLIHELIHFYCFDFGCNHIDYSKNSDRLQSIIKIKGKDSINEAYTETLATIINCMFYSYYHKKNLDTLLNLERAYLMFQFAKIIFISQGNSSHNIKDNKRDNNEIDYDKLVIKQKTSVRSYFVYKLFLFCNLDNFMRLIGTDLNVHKKIDSFTDLIIDSYKKFKQDETAFKIVSYFLKNIDEEYKKRENNNYDINWIYKTFRMTALEI